MAQIIGIINSKGGVGKSTLSVNLATALASQARVLLVDIDPQGSSLDWAAVRQAPAQFTTVGYPRPNLHKEIGNMARGYDYVILDGAGRGTDLARSAIMASDTVVIPVLPGQFDIWGSDETVNLCIEAAIFKPQLRYCFAVNRKIANTTLSKDVMSALASFPVPTLNAALVQRVAYGQSIPTGRAVFELEPNGKAAAEVDELLRHILAFAHNGQLLPAKVEEGAAA